MDYTNQRLSMMISILELDKAIDEDEAPLEAIWQVNAMLRSLVYKGPLVKFGPWSGYISKKNVKKCAQKFQKIWILPRGIFTILINSTHLVIENIFD